MTRWRDIHLFISSRWSDHASISPISADKAMRALGWQPWTI